MGRLRVARSLFITALPSSFWRNYSVRILGLVIVRVGHSWPNDQARFGTSEKFFPLDSTKLDKWTYDIEHCLLYMRIDHRSFRVSMSEQ